MPSRKKITIIGAGPAGMMAAITAAREGASVVLLEKMQDVGKKLFITGKGRCNVTNATTREEIIKNIPGNGAFLHSALNAFTPENVMDFFENLKVPLKIERGRRVFPVSDKSRDIIVALKNELSDLGVEVMYETTAKEILAKHEQVIGVLTKQNEKIFSDAVILAAGGASYPATGSNGDGYKMAEKVGHSVSDIFPSLVPLVTEEEWVKYAMGLSLKNVNATLFIDNKKKAELFGEMMFTHFGVTGPIVLSLSREASKALCEKKSVELVIDLKPALNEDKLDGRVVRDFEKYRAKAIKNALADLLPQKLIAPILDAACIDENQKTHDISKKERNRLIYALKHLLLTVTGTRPIAEAIVTAGGISVKEINPKKMASKIIKGLYFAGEVMDIDGFTGGFNLQAAFSTGHAAGFWSVHDE